MACSGEQSGLLSGEQELGLWHGKARALSPTLSWVWCLWDAAGPLRSLCIRQERLVLGWTHTRVNPLSTEPHT